MTVSPKVRNIALIILGALVLCFTSCGIGGASKEAQVVEVVKEVEVEVVKEVKVPGPIKEVEVVKEVEVEVTNEVTPQVCVDALNYADEGFGLASEAMEQISNLDVAGLDVTNAAMEELIPQYLLAKEACKTQTNGANA